MPGARLLRDLGRFGEALAAADAAVAIAPELADAHPRAGGGAAGAEAVRRGDRLVRCGAGAGAAVGRTLRAARAGAGRAQRLRGGDHRLHAGFGLAPDWARVHANRGWAYLFANAPELAFQDFDAEVRLAPSDPDGYGGRGAARVRLRQHRAAASDVEESLRRGEPTPRRLYNAARTYAQAAAVAVVEVRRAAARRAATP